MAGPLPLEGVRVVSVEQFGAGPFGSMYLADMGAEVIKVEAPGDGGDIARRTGPHTIGDGDSLYFQTFNRNKKSLTLDLKSDGGKRILARLAATSDAVMNNLRGDLPDKLGLTHAALAVHNPRIVCLHLSGYGRTGERAAWPAYDYLAQAEAGWLSLTGEPDAPPTRAGLSIVDFMTGMTSAFALTAAVLGALKTGRGRDIDVTLYDVAMHQLSYPATWYLNEATGTGRRPRGGHPSIVPCELFPTKDGHIFLMCIKPRFWELLCEGIGRPDLVADDRFSGYRERYRNRDALVAILDAALREKTTTGWMALFGGRIPCAPVLSMAEALDNPFFRERGGVATLSHPAYGPMKLVDNPIRLDGERLPGAAGPALGADTDAVLAGIGFTPGEIAALRADGAV